MLWTLVWVVWVVGFSVTVGIAASWLLLLALYFERRYPYAPGAYRHHSLRHVPAAEVNSVRAKEEKEKDNGKEGEAARRKQQQKDKKPAAPSDESSQLPSTTIPVTETMLNNLKLSDLFHHRKIVVVGAVPGEGNDSFAKRLARLLSVPYLQLTNSNIFLRTSETGELRTIPPSEISQKRKEYPTQVNNNIREFFRKVHFQGWVVELILDKWEVPDILLEDAWELIWLEYPLLEKAQMLAKRVVRKNLMLSKEVMFEEDNQPTDDETATNTKKPNYTNYWYSWRNLICFWDDNRSLLARVFRHHYKDQESMPFLEEKHTQLNLWTFSRRAEGEEFLDAIAKLTKTE